MLTDTTSTAPDVKKSGGLLTMLRALFSRETTNNEQKMKNNEIDKMLVIDRKRNEKIIKLILLGRYTK